MKTRLPSAIPLLVCCLLAPTVWASGSPTKSNSVSRATVELRDGSRVVGQFEQEALQFESELLGQLRLPVGRIRSIQWPRQDQELARLKAVNGDELTVRLRTPELRLKTQFGEVKLKPALMKQVQVSTAGGAGDLRRGLIALWSAEGNGRDSVEGHDGQVLFGADFAEGKVGKAFHFATARGRVYVPDAEDFDIDGSFTAGGWVYVSEFPSPAGSGTICQRGDNRPGLDTWSISTHENQHVSFGISSDDNQGVSVGLVPAKLGQWFHLAGVYDAEAGRLALYLDGELAAEKETPLKPIWRLDHSLEAGIGLGGTAGTMHVFPFRGLLDEWAIYGRALSDSDIRSLVDLGNGGERILPPGATAEE